MNKPIKNPEYIKQEKVFNNAFGRHQSMGIPASKKGKVYSKEEMLQAFENYQKEWDKLNSIDLFLECKNCELNKEKCIDCIYRFYDKG